jgi:hypothetical protein
VASSDEAIVGAVYATTVASSSVANPAARQHESAALAAG